ncbi:MAG TPA: DUF4012 domain-containing protein [Pengzhenrongella sp.]
MTHPGWGTAWSDTDVPAEGPNNPEAQRIQRHRRQVRRRRRIVRRVLLAGSLVLVVVVVGAAWVGANAWHARGELDAAAVQVQHMQAQVIAGDRGAAAVSLTSFKKHAASARADTRGPHWSVAGAVPWLGPNIRAAQTVSDVIDGLATKALPALMDATSLVDPAKLAPVNGRVDLAPLVKATPEVVAANAEVQTAVRRLDAIDSSSLFRPVAAPLASLRSQIGRVAMTTATAARAVELLPPMLGAGGPREYLVLVQNNAELRATGGVPTLIRLQADHGVVQVVETRSAGGNLGSLPKPVLPLTAQERALFGDGLGEFMADVTFTPDFPRSGELARAIWRQQVGSDLDGVLSIDAGALAGVLGATGPVVLPTGQALTAANAVQVLLNTVYLEILDPVKQDEFFATAAGSVFGAVMSGQGKPAAVVAALAQSARTGRLMVWSAHEDEQALLSGTVLSGELVGVQGDSPVIGVYLNDGTAAKIDYYLRTDVVATSTQCRPDGSQAVTVRVTLTSTAPANAADLPSYISGGGEIPKGEVRTNVLLYAPKGGLVDTVRVSTGVQGVFSQTQDGLAVAGKTIQLKPGEQVSIEYDVVTGPGQPGVPVLRVTPVTLGGFVTKEPTRCS